MAPSDVEDLEDNTEKIALYPEAVAEAELHRPRGDEDEEAVDDEDGDGDGGELFGTETMAELHARQGKLGAAIAIYERLLERDPTAESAARWRERRQSLERARSHVGEVEIISETRVPPPPPVPSNHAATPPVDEPAAPRPADRVTSEHRLPLIVSQPVRSGQVVYAQGSDLIVLGPVNPGGQVVADGHVHIYGPLRGRAVAGAQGCAEARIFCQRLEAELLVINGTYLVFEDLPPECVGKPAHIEVRDGQCIVKTL